MKNAADKTEKWKMLEYVKEWGERKHLEKAQDEKRVEKRNGNI